MSTPAKPALPELLDVYSDNAYSDGCEGRKTPSEATQAARAAIAAAVAEAQRQLGECTGGYQTLEREVVDLKRQLAEARAVPEEFCWLVELFEGDGTGNSAGWYHTGFVDIGGHSRTTKRPYEAWRYASRDQAEQVAAKLGHTLTGTWKAVEHGFSTPPSPAEPAMPAEPATVKESLTAETVPWPQVTRYSGGASHEGIGGRVWIRLRDEGPEVEYVPAMPAERVALSEEQLTDIWNKSLMEPRSVYHFARAVIAANDAELAEAVEANNMKDLQIAELRAENDRLRERLAEVGRDAGSYGNALNEAGWAFIASYHKHTGEPLSGKAFNASKGILRDAILTYVAALAAKGGSAPAPTQGGV